MMNFFFIYICIFTVYIIINNVKLMLSENNLSMAENYREDDFRVYFDIFGSDGLHLSSIALEKSTGVVNIVTPDGTNSENLLFFDPEYKVIDRGKLDVIVKSRSCALFVQDAVSGAKRAAEFHLRSVVGKQNHRKTRDQSKW